MTRLDKLEKFLKIAKEYKAPSRMLRRGSRDSSEDTAVSDLQNRLIELGYDLPRSGADGIFGIETYNAVIDFQRANGLKEDGIAGPNFFDKLYSASAASKPIINVDRVSKIREIANQAGGEASYDDIMFGGSNLSELGRQIGIDPYWLKAVLSQESNANSSAIRFEPHLFNRFMNKKNRPERMPHTPRDPEQCRRSGKGCPTATPSESDKAAFETAYKIDKEAAIRSTSWGLGQVMGEHLLKIQPDPDKAVETFYRDSAGISASLLVKWFKQNPQALQHAKNKDFKAFSLIYNGPAAPSSYWAKLERGYNNALAEHVRSSDRALV